MSSTRGLRQIFREPITWFLLLGALVFVLERFTSDTPELEIVVDNALRDRLSMVWQASYGRAPNPDELRGLVNEHLVEEMLYREALALGLDQQDQIIRRRLAQKIRFLNEDSLLLERPSEDALREWYEERQDQYAREPKISLQHIYLNPETQGARLNSRLKEIQTQLIDNNNLGQSPPVGDLFLLPNSYTDTPLKRVANDLGFAFVEALESLPVREWSDPIESAYGLHFVWIESRDSGTTPKFDDISESIGRDYQRAQREAANQAFIERLEAKYQVIELPDETSLDQSAKL